eukprot:52999-Eustigmatos_ZCMA.PRE.1
MTTISAGGSVRTPERRPSIVRTGHALDNTTFSGDTSVWFMFWMDMGMKWTSTRESGSIKDLTMSRHARA